MTYFVVDFAMLFAVDGDGEDLGVEDGDGIVVLFFVDDVFFFIWVVEWNVVGSTVEDDRGRSLQWQFWFLNNNVLEQGNFIKTTPINQKKKKTEWLELAAAHWSKGRSFVHTCSSVSVSEMRYWNGKGEGILTNSIEWSHWQPEWRSFVHCPFDERELSSEMKEIIPPFNFFHFLKSV